ncbi:hypothetical protein [Burkholderia metallica]
MTTKTGGVVGIPTSLRLDAISMTLADVIARCKKTGVIGQYLIPYTETKNVTVPGAPVGLGVISTAFARVRKKAASRMRTHRRSAKSGAFRSDDMTSRETSTRRHCSAI